MAVQPSIMDTPVIGTYPVLPPARSYPTASTAMQAYLADAFRAQQAYLAGVAIRDILAIWAQLDLGDVRASWPALRTALAALIRDRFAVNAAAGNAYFLQARSAAGVTEEIPLLSLPPALDEELIDITLDSTGPWGLLARIKTATQTVPQAVENTGVILSGAGSRLILNGARQAILQSVQEDAAAVAWYRVTAADPCSFCAMIASKGAVFKSEQAAGFLAHNRCHCSAAPAFSAEDVKALRDNDLYQQWKQATRGYSGKNALNAWRRYWESTHPGVLGAPVAA